MLAQNSTLQNSRFRVLLLAASNGNYTIYEAEDRLSGSTVLVCERPGLTATTFGSARRDHDGLVSIAERFTENGNSYLVSEPVIGSGPWHLRNRQRGSSELAVFHNSIRQLINGFSECKRQFPDIKKLDITPQHIRATIDGRPKFVFFEIDAPASGKFSETPYLPIESIWDSLDLATQRAISNEYDESALGDLEAVADERSDLYSFGAVLFQVLSGDAPPTALERAIEVLDSGVDPLNRYLTADGAIPPEYYELIKHSMQIRRSDRPSSFAEASAFVPVTAAAAAPQASSRPVIIDLDDADDIDLLEISVADPQPAAAWPKPEPKPEPHSVVATPITPKSDDLEPTHIDLAEVAVEIGLEPQKPEALFANFEDADLQNVDEIFEPNSGYESFDAPPKDDDILFTGGFLHHEAESQPAKSKTSPGVLVAGAAAAILIGVGSFWFMSGNGGERNISLPERPTAASLTQPASSEPVRPDTAQPVAATMTGDQTRPDVVSTDKPTSESPRPRPQTAELKQVKPADAKPPVKPDAKAKKSVTVDDLINDN